MLRCSLNRSYVEMRVKGLNRYLCWVPPPLSATRLTHSLVNPSSSSNSAFFARNLGSATIKRGRKDGGECVISFSYDRRENHRRIDIWGRAPALSTRELGSHLEQMSQFARDDFQMSIKTFRKKCGTTSWRTIKYQTFSASWCEFPLARWFKPR